MKCGIHHPLHHSWYVANTLLYLMVRATISSNSRSTAASCMHVQHRCETIAIDVYCGSYQVATLSVFRTMRGGRVE